MVSAPLPSNDQQLADDLTLIGIAVEAIDRNGAEPVFEMDITTNRVDAMNHYGIARECSALYDCDLKPIAPHVPEPDSRLTPLEQFPIQIEEPGLCARYTALLLRDVEVRPSVGNVVERFAALGQKAINNAADASNYTLLEMGHPTHVFDLDKLAGGAIYVRKARAGETITTLDGISRQLFEDDLVIADAERPVAIAGVIGGDASKVTESTRNILIESAWFDTATVRRTSRRHGLHTDASHRFERGADYNATPLACRRVAELILQSGSGRVGSGVIDKIARKIEIAPVPLGIAEVWRILGKEIGKEEIQRILTRLGFGVEALGNLDFLVSVPSWRLDVSREIDLVEEIARVHGFDRFPDHLPAFSGSVVELPAASKEEWLRAELLALGYHEAISNTFMGREDAARFTPDAVGVELANPLSEERALMRTSLLPGMLDMLEYNLNRGQSDVRLFEMGNTFIADRDAVEQRPSACFAATRPASKAAAEEKDWREMPFFQMKGDLAALLRGYEGVPEYIAAAPAYFAAGRSASVSLNSVAVAALGELAPAAFGARKFKQGIYACELYLHRLFAQPLRIAGYAPLSRFPDTERDFSFILPDGVSWGHVQNVVAQLRIPELRNFDIVEVFRGRSVAERHYSTLLRATFQSRERTLTDAEVAQHAARIVAAITALGGTLRGL